MLRINNPAWFTFEGVVALCLACALRSALVHNYADLIVAAGSAMLLAGAMAITRAYRPEVFELEDE